jgi:(E)-4-hydroxy-3-methylbut-2-enyl-diphosphate synthase
MRPNRKKTRPIRVGNLVIGGDAPVSIQSMTNVPLENIDATVAQIESLAKEGADLVRLAVVNEEALKNLRAVRSRVGIPLSADIHFNYKLAIGAIESGIDKIRINPGNIGSLDHVREIVRIAKERSVPIRIGVNGGSLDKKKYPVLTARALSDSALEHVQILEDCGFNDIVVSIKTSDINMTIEANTIFSEQRNYPLHIGLTEAGYGMSCVVQSSILIGHLLLKGLGDTVRVSMTGDPIEEVRTAKKILDAAGERLEPVRIIACPTCGRTDPDINLENIAREVEHALIKEFAAELLNLQRHLVVAVMGCEVNGPGEAAHADVGVAGARSGKYLLFAQGEKIAIITRNEIVEAIAREVRAIVEQWRAAR